MEEGEIAGQPSNSVHRFIGKSRKIDQNLLNIVEAGQSHHIIELIFYRLA